MRLSLLVPSNRPEKLEQFLNSLYKNTANKDEIEVVVLVDDDKNYVDYRKEEGVRIVTIHRIPDEVLNVSTLQYECLKLAEGDWIMLGNDDCVIETMGWDDQIKQGIEYFPDGISLVYPNDGMFGQMLACFPVISRKVIDLVGLFPMPYHRYKVDDTIFNLFPPSRRIYLVNCLFTHLNNQSDQGYRLPDGKFYPIDGIAGGKDQRLWDSELPRRMDMSKKLHEALGTPAIKVLIGVPTVEMARRAIFYDYFNILQKPDNTMMTFAHGQSPARNRNLIIEQALAAQATHVFFLDDDMAFEPDTLRKLLAHDVDIVTGFYLMRNHPHRPVIFDQRKFDNSCRPYFPSDSQTGLIEVVNSGFGAVLIKTDVFLKMQKPWVTLGDYTKDDWCDDISFFNRARDAGFKMYCDLDCPVGHMASVTVRPVRHEGVWHVSYDTDGEGRIQYPLPRPLVIEIPQHEIMEAVGV